MKVYNSQFTGFPVKDITKFKDRSILVSGQMFPMDTSLPVCHRFDIEIPLRKSVYISSIVKGESTWKG